MLEFLYLLSFCLIVSLSYFYGFFLNGFEIKPLFFALRLILMCFSSYVLSIIFFEKFKTNFLKLFKYFSYSFLISSVLGCIIFFIFPEINVFWSFLNNFGIEYRGDPHIKRFVSMYFDPNYFSAIAGFYFLISTFRSKFLNDKLSFLLCIFYSVLIFLSFSRSGIFSFFLIFLTLLIYELFSKKIYKFSISKILIVLMSFSIFISITMLYLDPLMHFISRFIHFYNDSSSDARFDSFQVGFDFIFKKPFFGLGYDYLSTKISNIRDVSSLDSSLINTFVNFGLVFTILIILLVFLWFYNFFIKVSLSKNSQFRESCLKIALYLFIQIFFTSQFNNLLYYQFFVIPMLSVMFYLFKCSSYFLYKMDFIFDHKRCR